MSDNRREVAFELRDVSCGFSGSDRLVLSGVSLSIARGEFVSFVGPSGCGKSTLLRLLAKLLTPAGGLLFHGDDDKECTPRTGFVFQHPTLLPWRTAAQNILLPLQLGRSPGGLRPPDHLIPQLLRQVGLSASDALKRPSQLSGGMQMRLSLARALATNPSVLLLDEPLAAVDDLLRSKLQEDIRRVHDTRGLTTVLVTHNLHEAIFLSDRVFVLAGSPSSVSAELAIEWPGERSPGFRLSPIFADCTRRLAAELFL